MLTVGYGQTARSTLGRLICVIILIWGLFTTSLFILLGMQFFSFSDQEIFAYNRMKKLDLKVAVEDSAIRMFSNIYRVRIFGRKAE